MKGDRRSFFRAMAAWFAGYLLSPAFSLFKRKVFAENVPMIPAVEKSPPASPVVAAEACADYDEERVYGAVKKALSAIGFDAGPGKKVLLKPNIMAQNTPDQATTTHPAVIGALCRIFRDKGCTVTIGDSSAFYQGGGTRLGFETTGIAEVAKKHGAALLPFEAASLRKITSGKVLNPFYVTEAVFAHDLVVNVPKLKLHRVTRYSGAMKNMYGCVTGGTKQRYHMLFQDRPDYREFWAKPLLDVYQAVNPGLTVMDAVVGQDKDGPAANGEPRQTGMLFASRSGPALDVAVLKMIGYDPLYVPMIREAVDRGLVIPDQVKILGALPIVPYAKLPDPRPKKGLSKTMDDFFFEEFVVTPKVKRSKCRDCSACVKACVPGAMSPDADGRAVIDYGKCISCYCCAEFCPKGAVSLHGGATNHVMRAARVILKL